MNHCEMINYLEEQYWRTDPADQHRFSQMVKHFTEMGEEIKQLKEDYHQKEIDEQTEIEERENAEEQIEDLVQQLNEESEQRLKNKECWMSVQKQYHEIKKENKKLMLRSHRSVVKLNTENKELKKRIDKIEMRLDASQQVNVCYAKVAGQANKIIDEKNQIDELCSNIEVKGDWISDYMAKAGCA